jgi:hypothetical protein
VVAASKIGLAQHPNEAFAQAPLLGLAALSLVQEDVSKLVELLPERLDPELVGTRARIDLWGAVVDGNTKRAVAASDALVSSVGGDTAAELARAKALLLLAESDVALRPDERTLDVLLRVSRKLADQESPDELRLRAAIDGAAVLHRRGKSDEAIELLAKHVPERMEPNGAFPLAVLAGSFLFALRGAAAEPSERFEYKQKLVKLLPPQLAPLLPGSVLAYRDAWLAELDYLSRADRCAGVAACISRAATQRRPAAAAFVARLGARQASLVERGVVSLGSVQLAFQYDVTQGIRPVVDVDLALPLAAFPPSFGAAPAPSGAAPAPSGAAPAPSGAAPAPSGAAPAPSLAPR